METCTHTEHNYTCVVVYSYPESTLMANQCPLCAAEIRIKELTKEKADMQDELESCEEDLVIQQQEVITLQDELNALRKRIEE